MNDTRDAVSHLLFSHPSPITYPILCNAREPLTLQCLTSHHLSSIVVY